MDTNNTPLVSVVMPVYNGERYLREAIESILSQTYTNLELIIINDGSQDASEDIIKSYADYRIVYLINEQNSGICITLNRGLDVARGKYIARMDCDDISMPERLQEQVNFLEQNAEIGIVGSDIIMFGEDREDRYFDFVHDKDQCKAGVLFNSPFAHPSVMFRANIIRENNLHYNDQYRGREDFEMWYQMSKVCDFANLPCALLRYRVHKGQITQNRTPNEDAKSIAFIRQRFEQYKLNAEEQESIIDYCLMRWSAVDDLKICHLYSSFKKVIKHRSSCSSPSYHKAMQITLSKALVYAMNQSPLVSQSRAKVYSKALVAGIMPVDWYCKFLYNAYLR